ncbi:cell wall hydrolase [Pseudoroseicyclus aestuarii]|uniref:Cell wall hydrolase n=1 Tax=Pseudoroseicyclus aestuarii TaxID=1795041 RepID=A0A318SP73_9RHOB|nr:cell wall hydrolase [Pseudoroseicyclus aestuarii]PYE81395.1 cell wall hydrolase [Pseudoroseicyclus aestuarii]
MTSFETPRLLALLAVCALLGGCGIFRGAPSETECMTRAMYFESNRSSRDGMIAVGHVVMNRVASPDFPGTVCGVVSQKNQFAPGVMRRDMTDRGLPLAQEAAVAVMRGERHPLVANAQYFHAASYRAGYNNMHYTVTAGGNAFYERRRPELVTQPVPLPQVEGLTGRRWLR